MSQEVEAVFGECFVCHSSERVVNCNHCGKVICGKHRAGLGSVSDGYTCVTGECIIHGFGFPVASAESPVSDVSHLRLRLRTTFTKGDIVLYLVVICLIASLVILGL